MTTPEAKTAEDVVSGWPWTDYPLSPSAGAKIRVYEHEGDQADNPCGSEDPGVRAELVVAIEVWLPPCSCPQPSTRMNMLTGETTYRCINCLNAHPDQRPLLCGDRLYEAF